jgi:chromosome segregation ATPase
LSLPQLRAEIENLMTERDVVTDTLNSEIRRLQGLVDSERTHDQLIQEPVELSKHQMEITRFEEQSKELQKQLVEAQQQHSEQDSQLRGEIKHLQQQLEECVNQLNDKSELCGALQSKLELLEPELTNANFLLKQERETNNDLQVARSGLETKVAELHTANEAVLRQVLLQRRRQIAFSLKCYLCRTP